MLQQFIDRFKMDYQMHSFPLDQIQQSPIQTSEESSSQNTLEECSEQEVDAFGFSDTNAKNEIQEYSPKQRFYRFNDEIGFGSYKSVYRAYDSDTGKEVAWNVIKLMKLPLQQRKRLTEQISILKNICHKRVINFINAWLNKTKNQMIFMTEMVCGGSLKQHLRKVKKPRLKIIKGWCKEILEGLEYLHSQEPPIIHRDIKCENIFINTNTNEIKIGDLGLAISTRNSYAETLIGTPEFMAPEIFQGKYGTSVDIYAFGMCVLEIVTLQTPYQECDSLPTIYKYIEHRIKPKCLNLVELESLRKFITRCFSESSERPTASQLLEDDFLKPDPEIDNQEIEIKDIHIIYEVSQQEESTLKLEPKVDKNVPHSDQLPKQEQGFKIAPEVINNFKALQRDSIISINNHVPQNGINPQTQKKILQKSQELFRQMYKEYRQKLFMNSVRFDADFHKKIYSLENAVLDRLHLEDQKRKTLMREEIRRETLNRLGNLRYCEESCPELEGSKEQKSPSYQELINSEKGLCSSIKMSNESLNLKVEEVVNPVKTDENFVEFEFKDLSKELIRSLEMKSQEYAVAAQTNKRLKVEKINFDLCHSNSMPHEDLLKEDSKSIHVEHMHYRKASLKQKFQYQTNSEPAHPFDAFSMQAPPVFQNVMYSPVEDGRAKTEIDPKLFQQNTECIPTTQKSNLIERPISSRPIRNQQHHHPQTTKDNQFHRTNTMRSQKIQPSKKQQDIVLLLKAKKIQINFPISKNNNSQKQGIIIIQNILNRLLDQKLDALGIFGHYTEELVKRYQNINKVAINGVVERELFVMMIGDFERSLSCVKKEKEMNEMKEKQVKIRKEKEFEAQKLLSELENQILNQE